MVHRGLLSGPTILYFIIRYCSIVALVLEVSLSVRPNTGTTALDIKPET